MKKIFIILIAAVAATVSCSKINELDDRVGKLETRMDAVETAISEINTNIASLQAIVAALSQKDYIKEVKDIKDASNNVIGYELIFDKKGSVKIYHGTNGAQGQTGPQGPQGPQGATPQIGVALFTDGLYLELGRHGVAMARQLRSILLEKGYPLLIDSPTNQLFPILTKGKAAELEARAVVFEFWEPVDADRIAVRFACSWGTPPEDVAALGALL